MSANFCTSCGAKLKPDAKFCVNCGSKVTQFQNELESETNIHLDDIESTFLETESPNSRKNILLGFYILLNLPFYALSDGNEEMIGFLIYSIIITILISLRIKKENTFNWVLKVLIGLQLLFIISILISQIEFLFDDLLSSTGTILFFLLGIVLLMMLIKGNKK